MKMEVIAFDIRRVLQSLDSFYQPIARNRQVQLTMSVEEPVAGTLFGDPNRLRQILSNLLSNALKFSQPQGRVRLTIRMYCGSHCVVNGSDPQVCPNGPHFPDVKVNPCRTCLLEFEVNIALLSAISTPSVPLLTPDLVFAWRVHATGVRYRYRYRARSASHSLQEIQSGEHIHRTPVRRYRVCAASFGLILSRGVCLLAVCCCYLTVWCVVVASDSVCRFVLGWWQ